MECLYGITYRTDSLQSRQTPILIDDDPISEEEPTPTRENPDKSPIPQQQQQSATHQEDDGSLISDPVNESGSDDEQPIRIMGSYVQDGTIVSIAPMQLPTAILAAINLWITTTTASKPKWINKNLPSECTRLRMGTQTKYKWSVDGKSNPISSQFSSP